MVINQQAYIQAVSQSYPGKLNQAIMLTLILCSGPGQSGRQT